MTLRRLMVPNREERGHTDMELREFIKETLIQVVEGVRDAQAATAQTGAAISPCADDCGYALGGKVSIGPLTGPGTGFVQYVSFDVGLTSADQKEKKGGVGVFFGSLGAGGQASSQSQSGAVTRVQFVVPVVLPSFRRSQ